MTKQNEQTIARIIYDAFQAYRDKFSQITHAAKHRFESADWAGIQDAGNQRLESYNHYVNLVMQQAPELQPNNIVNWQALKAAYTNIIDNTTDANLAETFFNSVYREHTEDGPCDGERMYLQRSSAKRNWRTGRF